MFDFTFKVWVQKITSSSSLLENSVFPHHKFLESWYWSKYCTYIPPPKGQFFFHHLGVAMMVSGSDIAPLRCAGQLVELASDAELGVPWWCKLTLFQLRFFLPGWRCSIPVLPFKQNSGNKSCIKFWNHETWELELFWSFFFDKSEDFGDLRSSEASKLRNFGRWCSQGWVESSWYKSGFPLRYLTCPKKDIE